MGHIEHQYLRPIKAMRRQIMLDSPFPKCEQLQTQAVEHGTIFPLRDLREPGILFGRGGVVDASGKYVPSSSFPERVNLAYEFTSSEYRDQKVVYCGYMAPQWGHFLVESVTRLWYFLENDTTIDKYVFFLDENEDREIKGNYREFLELFGIWDKLEFINKPITYRQILIPGISYCCQTFYSQKYLDIFDRVADHVVPQPDWTAHEKIYFSRSSFRIFGDLLEFGHDLLDDFFERNGYTRLHPENLSLSQLIYYIRNARITATLSGSVEHNVLFARNEQSVEVLERLVYNDDHQTDIDRMRDLNITYIDANLPIYLTDFGGPGIVGYTECLERFAEDHQYIPPSPAFLTEKYRKQCFASYMKTYWMRYHHRLYTEDWFGTCMDYLSEGQQAGYAYFHDYVDGKKPYLPAHYFNPYYIKLNAKYILHKLKLLR